MSGEIMTFLTFIVCLVSITGVLIFVIRKQQRQIDTLNDRLMARSFVDYKSAQGIKEDDVSPVRDEQEPKGWYDH